MSAADGYEEYEPLQPVSSYEPMKYVSSDSKLAEKEKSIEEKLDEMSISSHSGQQLQSLVMTELKSKINGSDGDADLPPSDYPDGDYPVSEEVHLPVEQPKEENGVGHIKEHVKSSSSGHHLTFKL